MTSTVTFLLAVSVLICAVHGTYYYDPAFAANVLTAVKLALTNIAQPTEGSLTPVLQFNHLQTCGIVRYDKMECEAEFVDVQNGL
ncbi:hypothetical protein CHS0354_009463 [Potamilus streckersoni]|uniref:Uncharacterized protein n=1 Tax=Potamilus streckersoni TaxID=2493646 RepID=A0AAE0WE10_9BIVA|nr:hypothetical protein CHS0354_009463 [Potamilus streckersoni]